MLDAGRLALEGRQLGRCGEHLLFTMHAIAPHEYAIAANRNSPIFPKHIRLRHHRTTSPHPHPQRPKPSPPLPYNKRRSG